MASDFDWYHTIMIHPTPYGLEGFFSVDMTSGILCRSFLFLLVYRYVCQNPNNRIKNTIFIGLCQNQKCASSSLSHITKVCRNLKSALKNWRVAFLLEDIGDPSTVQRFNAAGSILVLEWSSIILYTLVHIDNRAYQGFKAFPTCTPTVG